MDHFWTLDKSERLAKIARGVRRSGSAGVPGGTALAKKLAESGDVNLQRHFEVKDIFVNLGLVSNFRTPQAFRFDFGMARQWSKKARNVRRF